MNMFSITTSSPFLFPERTRLELFLTVGLEELTRQGVPPETRREGGAGERAVGESEHRA